ncbi:enoyl-CoA hydratase/isomerase family protein [Pyruvatibacter mobilis]|uniref:enoyl-CoA hydratase/isomerase family protein n=1 Tax=Pyruvatibacter mobilis TaxID=1712261 RepID=UPI003BB1EE88
MTTLPDVTGVELELDKGWLTIWFDQPDTRNALTDDLVDGITRTFKAVRDDRSVRGITLRGRHGVFCAGGNLKQFKESFQGGGSRDDIIEMSKGAAELFDLINDAPQVVIAIIEGAAMAGGFGMACCADVVICEAGAKFAMTETAIGISPAQIAPFVIQKLGYATGRRLMLTAARFDGRGAHDLGFADFVADDVAGLNAAEQQIRSQVLKCAPGAIADTKSLILSLPGMSRPQVVQAAAENFAGRLLSDEGREGVASFLEKRKPVWAE